MLSVYVCNVGKFSVRPGEGDNMLLFLSDDVVDNSVSWDIIAPLVYPPRHLCKHSSTRWPVKCFWAKAANPAGGMTRIQNTVKMEAKETLSRSDFRTISGDLRTVHPDNRPLLLCCSCPPQTSWMSRFLEVNLTLQPSDKGPSLKSPPSFKKGENHQRNKALAVKMPMRCLMKCMSLPMHIDQGKVLITCDPTTVGTKEGLGPTATSS